MQPIIRVQGLGKQYELGGPTAALLNPARDAHGPRPQARARAAQERQRS